MNADRLKQLEEFYREEPDDPFNVYALALEYQKSYTDKAAEFFDLLLRKHAEYLPAYYHAAKFFQNLGHEERAINTYDKVIALATKVKDHKALRELRSAYDELMLAD